MTHPNHTHIDGMLNLMMWEYRVAKHERLRRERIAEAANRPASESDDPWVNPNTPTHEPPF